MNLLVVGEVTVRRMRVKWLVGDRPCSVSLPFTLDPNFSSYMTDFIILDRVRQMHATPVFIALKRTRIVVVSSEIKNVALLLLVGPRPVCIYIYGREGCAST